MGFFMKQPRRADPQAPAETGRHRRPQAGQGEAGPKVQAVLQLHRRRRGRREAGRRGVAPPQHRHGGPGLPREALQAVQGPDPVHQPRAVQAEEEAEDGPAVPLQLWNEDHDRGIKGKSHMGETKLPQKL